MRLIAIAPIDKRAAIKSQRRTVSASLAVCGGGAISNGGCSREVRSRSLTGRSGLAMVIRGICRITALAILAQITTWVCPSTAVCKGGSGVCTTATSLSTFAIFMTYCSLGQSRLISYLSQQR